MEKAMKQIQDSINEMPYGHVIKNLDIFNSVIGRFKTRTPFIDIGAPVLYEGEPYAVQKVWMNPNYIGPDGGVIMVQLSNGYNVYYYELEEGSDMLCVNCGGGVGKVTCCEERDADFCEDCY
jgi:hypothetical protein